MATIRELADYYVGLMASIYRTKTKASDTVALFAKQLLADNFISEFNAGFDIDQAVGAQLDILGKYIGAPRDVGVADTKPYFGFVGYDYPAGTQNENGFVLYASLATNAQGIWFEYEFRNQATTQLPDYSYRQLMKLKIATNNTENTMSAIQQQIADFFPGQLQLRDNKDMSLTYFFGGSFQLPLSVLEAYLPRPMGVLVEAVEAIAFDVFADGNPVFNSETPNPAFDFGEVEFSTSALFTLTNAKTSNFTVIAVTVDDPLFTVDNVSPSLPAALSQGDSLNFRVAVSSANQITASAVVSVFITSSQGLSRFDFAVTVSITGVSITWIGFDNFSGYSDGTISSLNDSWGWANNGTFNSLNVLISSENFSSYSNGTIAALNGGTGWLANGIFTVY